MSNDDPCAEPQDMLSTDVETEFVESIDELEARIAADLRRGREGTADDATTDGGQ
ncbi:MAG: hypothetical protein ABEH83_04010 [Halobacterium sp.]